MYSTKQKRTFLKIISKHSKLLKRFPLHVGIYITIKLIFEEIIFSVYST